MSRPGGSFSPSASPEGCLCHRLSFVGGGAETQRPYMKPAREALVSSAPSKQKVQGTDRWRRQEFHFEYVLSLR